jgi:hypothetical protein
VSAGISATEFNLEPHSSRSKAGHDLHSSPAPAYQDLVAGQIDLLLGALVQLPTGSGREHRSLRGDKGHESSAGLGWGYVGSTSGVPQIPDDLSRRSTRQPWTRSGSRRSRGHQSNRPLLPRGRDATSPTPRSTPSCSKPRGPGRQFRRSPAIMRSPRAYCSGGAPRLVSARSRAPTWSPCGSPKSEASVIPRRPGAAECPADSSRRCSGRAC